MTFEDFENLTSLFCTIVGLLYCVFKYIETPKRGYRYIIVFFLANFLSEYYWTIYQLVMGSYPNVSQFAAYLGWNIAYLFLLFAVFSMRQEGAKRFFHPVMLLPVLTNIPQFILYIQYGGLLNNLWQVGVTTITLVFCLQDLLYYLKRKEDRKFFPYLPLFVVAYLISQYGMWTASCFSWISELRNPYLYFSVLSSVFCIFFPYGVREFYEARESEKQTKSASEMRFQILLQTVVSLVIIGFCLAGFITAFWIKNSFSNENGMIQNEGQLVIYLFVLSAVLILLVLILLFVLSTRYLHVMNSSRIMNEGKRSRLNFIITIAVTLALMVFAVVYNNMILYNLSVVGVYEDAEEEIKTTATELENYLTVATTTLRVAADSVDLMAKNGSSIQEIEQYIVDQTTIQSRQFDENFTGLYAYINGKYLDGLGWVPPEDYDPTARDWYKAAVEANGEIVIISPYVDAQTGSVVITIGKSISGAEKARGNSPNVVCLDVIVNHIQDITQSVEITGKGYGMVISSDGFIIAHQEESFNGQNITDLYGQTLLNQIVNANGEQLTAMMNDETCTLFVSPVMDQ